MRLILLLISLHLLLVTAAQQTDTFIVIRESEKAKGKPLPDTFVQRTYLSQKSETANRIIFRTGIKITAPGLLIYFKATQSILDSMGLGTDKNASIGDYTKITCSQTTDSLLFIYKQRKPSMLNPGSTVEITKGYSGAKIPGKIVMEVNTTSNSNDVPRNTKQIPLPCLRKSY